MLGRGRVWSGPEKRSSFSIAEEIDEGEGVGDVVLPRGPPVGVEPAELTVGEPDHEGLPILVGEVSDVEEGMQRRRADLAHLLVELGVEHGFDCGQTGRRLLLYEDDGRAFEEVLVLLDEVKNPRGDVSVVAKAAFVSADAPVNHPCQVHVTEAMDVEGWFAGAREAYAREHESQVS